MKRSISVGQAQVEPTYKLWQKVRFPLAAAIVIVVLVVTAVVIGAIYVSRSIRVELARATDLAASDTIDSHQQAAELLERLRTENPDHEAILTRRAWQKVLVGLRYGSSPEQRQAAARALETVPDGADSPLFTATKAGLALLEGRPEEALELSSTDASDSEGLFILGLARARQGDVEPALTALDQARSGSPPFLPALAELAVLLRERGRHVEAASALKVLRQASPEHRGALVESVLLDLDRFDGQQEKLLGLAGALGKKLDDAGIGAEQPRTLAYKRSGAGRIALLTERNDEAVVELTAAAEYFPKNQSLATRLAVAHRRNNDHERGLKALESFPNESSTDLRLLQTRLDLLMDLQRTTDAVDTLAALTKAEVKGMALLEGRRLLAQGEAAAAIEPLQHAIEEGDDEAALDLAEAYVAEGQTPKARRVLRRLRGDGPLPLCAGGFQAYLDGFTKRAAARLAGASKIGGRCGAVLAGRYLLGTGGAEDQQARLQEMLNSREDLRDRVALGRILFRTKGLTAARAELDRVRERSPQAAALWHELTLAYEELGLTVLASEVATEGLEETDGHPLLVSVAARLAREAGELDTAEQILSSGLEAHPDDRRILLEQASLLFARHRLPPAREVVVKIALPGPTFADAICLQSEIKRALGESQEAHIDLVRSASKATASTGALAEAEIRACQVHIHLRRGAASLGRAKTSLYFLQQLPVRWAEIPYLEGRIAEQENRLGHAENHYRRALKMDPAHRASWQALAKLGRLTEGDAAGFELRWPGQDPESP